jgi:hypothetical protein
MSARACGLDVVLVQLNDLIGEGGGFSEDGVDYGIADDDIAGVSEETRDRLIPGDRLSPIIADCFASNESWSEASREQPFEYWYL